MAIERSGRAGDGNYYSMRGINLKHLVDPIDDLFIAAKNIAGIMTTGGLQFIKIYIYYPLPGYDGYCVVCLFFPSVPQMVAYHADPVQSNGECGKEVTACVYRQAGIGGEKCWV